MVKTYSLLDHTISFTFLDPTVVDFNGKRSLELTTLGSFLGKVTVSKTEANVTMNADVTGGVVFNYSHNHSGKCEFEFSYVSEYTLKLLKALYDKYVGTDAPNNWRKAMVDIVISSKASPTAADATGQGVVVSCSNCYLDKLPDLDLGAEVGTRTFTFLVADVQYK